MPLVAEAAGRTISVGEPYFNLTFTPMLGLLLVILPVVQAWAWGKADLKAWSKWAIGGAGLALVFLALGTGLWDISIGAALGLIFKYAFTPVSAAGGFAGAAVAKAIQYGVARGVFSNEAGLGSAPIAHAAAQTKNPVRQGLVAMLGTFIDTIVVCSVTALAILTSAEWTSGETGAALTGIAFDGSLPGVGQYVVSFALAVFAFTTILGWAFYGEKCCEYLFGVASIKVYRVIYILAIFAGAVAPLEFVWLMASVFNALMAIPNLIALALLSPVVFKLSRDYFAGKTVLPGEDLGR